MNNLFEKITHKDLIRWAGSTIVSRGESYKNNVKNLSKIQEGGLIAWVSGSEPYLTKVNINKYDGLTSDCTCPYHDTCKHAVAVILEYLSQQNVPTISNADIGLMYNDPNTKPDNNFNFTTLHNHLESKTKQQLYRVNT